MIGPSVNGFFALATEAKDDAGLPHTLEHLVFLGSEDYPAKGVLDTLACRSLGEQPRIFVSSGGGGGLRFCKFALPFC
jgi:hypothetical protein